MSDIYQDALKLHAEAKGKLEVQLKVPLNESHDLSFSLYPLELLNHVVKLRKIKTMFINIHGSKTV